MYTSRYEYLTKCGVEEKIWHLDVGQTSTFPILKVDSGLYN